MQSSKASFTISVVMTRPFGGKVGKPEAVRPNLSVSDSPDAA
jgi:hypothetical protein